MSVTLCPHGARGLMACPECEKAAFKPKPTTKRRCRICGGNHGEEWHALGAYAKIVEEERDQAERERDEARAERDRLAGLLRKAVHAIDTRYNKSLVGDIEAALAEIGGGK